MKLYYSPGTCALASNISLHEAGIAFDAVKVDLKTKKTEGGEDFLAVNPKGYVPALQLDSGELLTENIAVLQYIADLKPEANLAPKWGTIERYRLVEWLAFVSTEIHKSLSVFFKPEASEDWKKAQRDNVTRRFNFLEQKLTTQPYLMGEQFTIPDAYLFTVMRWHKLAQLDLVQWPALNAFFERVKARPKVMEALQMEGLLKK